jgi:hypothetical protein
MFRLAAIVLVLLILLPPIMPRTISTALPSLSGTSEVWAQTNRTDLMQQSDHKRRAAATKKTEPEPVQQQEAGIIPLEADAGGGDYAILAVLVASLVILAFVAACGKKIRFRSRRRTR